MLAALLVLCLSKDPAWAQPGYDERNGRTEYFYGQVKSVAYKEFNILSDFPDIPYITRIKNYDRHGRPINEKIINSRKGDEDIYHYKYYGKDSVMQGLS